jgi:hypothetical protein
MLLATILFRFWIGGQRLAILSHFIGRRFIGRRCVLRPAERISRSVGAILVFAAGRWRVYT